MNYVITVCSICGGITREDKGDVEEIEYEEEATASNYKREMCKDCYERL